MTNVRSLLTKVARLENTPAFAEPIDLVLRRFSLTQEQVDRENEELRQHNLTARWCRVRSVCEPIEEGQP